jgi:hypothetical protein
VLSVSIQDRTRRRVGDDGGTSDHWSNPNDLPVSSSWSCDFLSVSIQDRTGRRVGDDGGASHESHGEFKFNCWYKLAQINTSCFSTFNFSESVSGIHSDCSSEYLHSHPTGTAVFSCIDSSAQRRKSFVFTFNF